MGGWLCFNSRHAPSVRVCVRSNISVHSEAVKSMSRLAVGVAIFGSVVGQFAFAANKDECKQTIVVAHSFMSEGNCWMLLPAPRSFVGDFQVTYAAKNDSGCRMSVTHLKTEYDIETDVPDCVLFHPNGRVYALLVNEKFMRILFAPEVEATPTTPGVREEGYNVTNTTLH
jgi:hypothetical protein